MMTEQPRSPFVVQRDFIETAFEVRFQGMLRSAWRNRSWHIIAAVPGSGKSLGIRALVTASSARKEAGARTFLPLLAFRAPKNGATEEALCQRLSEAVQ